MSRRAATLTPTVSQRRVKSSIAVASGQTVLLAGLISERQDKQPQRPAAGRPARRDRRCFGATTTRAAHRADHLHPPAPGQGCRRRQRHREVAPWWPGGSAFLFLTRFLDTNRSPVSAQRSAVGAIPAPAGGRAQSRPRVNLVITSSRMRAPASRACAAQPPPPRD